MSENIVLKEFLFPSSEDGTTIKRGSSFFMKDGIGDKIVKGS